MTQHTPEQRLAEIRRVVNGQCPCGCGGLGPTNCLQVAETLDKSAEMAAEIERLKLSVESYEADHQAAEEYVGELESKIDTLKDVVRQENAGRLKAEAQRDALLSLIRETVELREYQDPAAAHLDYISRARAAIEGCDK